MIYGEKENGFIAGIKVIIKEFYPILKSTDTEISRKKSGELKISETTKQMGNIRAGRLNLYRVFRIRKNYLILRY